MAEKIIMPRLSDTMTEGVIAEWHKSVGEKIKKGDLLAEIETDKATQELESYKDGVLLHIGVAKGGVLQVNDLLAIVGEEGEDISDLLKGTETNNSGEAESNVLKAMPNTEAEKIAPIAEKEATKKPALDIANMKEVVLMPRLSDTMTEGVIANWTKNVGDTVKKGEVLAEIETDKATMELDSYKEGTLLYQGAKVGEKIAVNDLLCIIGNAAEIDVKAIIESARIGTSSVAASPDATEKMVETEGEEVEIAGNNESAADGQRIKISPLAKKLADEKGIKISELKGTGDLGRIVKADIDSYVPAVKKTAAPAEEVKVAEKLETKASPALSEQLYTEVPVSQMRKVIAKRLSESKFTAPHFYLTMAIEMDNAIASRAKLNEVDKNIKISFNDMILKACAVALTLHPAVNSSWLGDKIRYNQQVNIGVAVAVEDGLLVPVVRNANTKSLSAIGKEVKDFAQRAKDKKLQPHEWEGNTFTISNLGMFGIDEFTAIINPPDACILAVGGISEVALVKNGALVPGNVMKVTLSCDHRVVDGATGAAFLQTLKLLLENPIRMML